MRLASLLLALALPLPLSASPAPTTVTVGLSNYRFEPAVIRLRRGQPYILNLVNRSGRGHNFVAPDFFAAAGFGFRKVEVPPRGAAKLALTAPAAGRYRVKCTHFTHALRGMKGEILVE